MFVSEWREFPSASCLAKKKNLTASVSMLLKSRASLTCFRACFLSGRATELSAPRYLNNINLKIYELLPRNVVKYTNQLTVLMKQCGVGERFYQLVSFAAFQL